MLAYELSIPVYLINYISCKLCDFIDHSVKIGNLSFDPLRKINIDKTSSKNVLFISDIETRLLFELGMCGLLFSDYNGVRALTDNKVLLTGDPNQIIEFEKCIFVNHSFDLPFFEVKEENENNIILLDAFNTNSIFESTIIKTKSYQIFYDNSSSLRRSKSKIYLKQSNISEKELEIQQISKIREEFFTSGIPNLKKLGRHTRTIESYSKYKYIDTDNYNFIYSSFENFINKIKELRENVHI